MFALVDVNNFYTSCETVFRPDLKGKPIVVVSSNDGYIIPRSAEAKSLGIKNGELFSKIKNNLYYSGVYLFSSNYALYANLNDRVMQTLTAMSPSIEIYSIDETFVSLSGVTNRVPLSTLGHKIRTHVLKNTGLTAGIGIVQTKTLVKLANHAAKTWRDTGDVVDLSNVVRQRRLLVPAPVGEVWGVGRKMSKKLNLMGINAALDLVEGSLWVIKKHFNVTLEGTAHELRGEPRFELQELSPARQQIICSRSLSNWVTQYSDIYQAICAYAEQAAEELRSGHQFYRFVNVFVRMGLHVVNETYYGSQMSVKLLTPSSDARDIVNCVTNCLQRTWIDDYRCMRAGVMLADFFSNGIAQLNLFDDSVSRKNSATLMDAIDQLNQSGRGEVWFAGQGIEKSQAVKCEILSPAYTTRYLDLPVAK